jgi:hypothetical protein
MTLSKMGLILLVLVAVIWGTWMQQRIMPSEIVAEGRNELGFRTHVINAESAYEAAGVLDVNRDGRLDIFSGGFWYESPSWKKHFVREIPEQDEYYLDFAALPVDVDGDGWTDTISAAWHNRSLFWVRNPGKTGNNRFEVIPIDTPGNMETAILVDINGDRKQDVLPNISNEVAWYDYQPDSTSPHGVRWTKHSLPTVASGHGIGAGDVNGDGRNDIIGPKGWLEQPFQSDISWIWHPEFDLDTASIPILIYDVDGDGDADLIYGNAHNYGLYWMEQSMPAGGERAWTRHEIDREWSQVHFLLLADLDNDKQLELVTGKRYRAHNGHDPGEQDPLCVYYYHFQRDNKTWLRHTIHSGGKVGFGINTVAADLDGDGDLDIVAPGKSGLYLLENLLK